MNEKVIIKPTPEPSKILETYQTPPSPIVVLPVISISIILLIVWWVICI